MPPVSAVRVVLAGEIDLATAADTDAALRNGVAEAKAAGSGMVVDLAAVTFLDSTGLACLARASTELARCGGVVRVEGASAMVARLLELAGLQHLVEPD